MRKLQLLLLGCTFFFVAAVNWSCNTSGVTPTYYSRLKVVNTLAGSSPIVFLLNGTTANSSASITFPYSSGYLSVKPGTKFFQVALATTSTVYFTTKTFDMGVDSSYSVFVTGASGSYTSILTKDTLVAPSKGKARIRFVNTSNNSGSLDVTLNAVSGYSNITYTGVTSFIEVPAGTYEFKAYKTGTNSTLATLSGQVLADGSNYTLYSAGSVNSTATNAVFQLVLMSNILPATQ